MASKKEMLSQLIHHVGNHIRQFDFKENLKEQGFERVHNSATLYYYFADFNRVYVKLIDAFEKVALPYFMKNGSVKRVDELLNSHPNEYSVHMRNDLFRFTKGVIAAKLNNNPRVNELFDTYNSLIIQCDMPENCKTEMERLKAILPFIGANLNV